MQPFTTVGLPLSGRHEALEEALQRFTVAERISDFERRGGGGRTAATKQMSFHDVPEARDRICA